MSTAVFEGLRLTAEQTAIVDHPLEPLRIVAGAGTGKTTTVAARIAAQVNRGLDPESVLGLTFTNKAAAELADKVGSALPDFADAGREVEVTTYHGFASGLLREFGALVGIERDARLIGHGFTRQLLHDSLDGAAYQHVDLTAPAHRVSEAALLARRLAEHLACPDDVRALAPETPDPVWTERTELAEIVERYEQAKKRLGVVDYGDLLREAHRIVATYPDVCRRIRDRYRHLVLDEYQDTDAAQRSLLRVLFGDGFAVTAVGDEDQMIYEWRGASLTNFRSFPTDFPRPDGTPASTLPLTRNRRSGRQILAVANAVRGCLRPDAALTPLQSQAGAAPASVELRLLRTADEEALWVAAEIRRLHDEAAVAWKDMAVLFRKNRHIGVIRDALDTEGVPFEIVTLGGLLDVPQVADLHAWLRIVGRPHDSAAAVRTLLGGTYRLGLGDIAPLSTWASGRGRIAHDYEASPRHLLDAVDRLDEIEGLSADARSRITEFGNVYRSVQIDAQSLTLADLCAEILDMTHAWDEIDALSPAARVSARLNIYRFLDVVRDWSPLQGRASLEAFLGYLDALVEERAAEELDAARVSSADAVSLLTVHRAKGLEWDTVFLPAAARGIFPATPLGYDDPDKKASSLPQALRLDATEQTPGAGTAAQRRKALQEAHQASERRAAYVAVTRARRRLVISSAWWYTGRKSRGPSELFDLARSTADAVTTVTAEAPGSPPIRLAASSSPAPDPLFVAGWQGALRHALEDDAWLDTYDRVDRAAYDVAVEQFELMLEGLPQPPPSSTDVAALDVSVTGLVTLAHCPRRFEWSVVDPLPRRRTTAQRRGVELHRLIELHNRGQVPFTDLHDAPTTVTDPGPAVEDRAERSGFAAFLATRYGEIRPRWTEAPIDVRIGDGRIRGRIDAVYEDDDGSWEIVDFKSGRRSKQPSRRVQLQAYAVAAADGALDSRPASSLRVTFAYLGGGMADTETEIVDDAWLETARSTLRDLLQQARSRPYVPRPGAACRSCDFVGLCDEGAEHVAGAASAAPPGA